VIDVSTNLLQGFNMGNMAGSIANGLGGYFGSQLGNLAVKPKSPQSALFGSAAAAVSTYVASTAAAAAAIPLLGIPVIGPLLAAFAAQTLGNMLGNALWDDDRVAHYTLFTDTNGTVQYGNPYTQDGVSLVFSEYLAKTSRDSINSIYGNASASIDANRAFKPFQLGWYVNSHNQKIMFTRSTEVQASLNLQEAQGLIAASVEYAVADSEMAGGDLFMRLAYTASHKAGLAQLSFDLQVSKDFRKYVENTATINSVIADSPTSDFSAGWIATLQRAKELGLDRLANFNAMEYLASHRDLEQASGRDKAAAERHMIETGIPEGRRVQFDSLQYLAADPDVAQAVGSDRDLAAIHYMEYGRNEGRQAAELTGAVTRVALPDHRPGLHVEGCKQAGGAVPGIVVSAPLRLSGSQRQQRLRAVERQDLGSLVHAQRRGPGGRRQIEPDYRAPSRQTASRWRA
jgi:hypothetical protein